MILFHLVWVCKHKYCLFERKEERKKGRKYENKRYVSCICNLTKKKKNYRYKQDKYQQNISHVLEDSVVQPISIGSSFGFFKVSSVSHRSNNEFSY